MYLLRLPFLILTLTAGCGFASTLPYDALFYQMSGNLPFDAPVNAYSAPGSLPFTITFTLPAQPVPVPLSVWAHGFEVSANLHYTLGTGPAIDIAKAPIDFFDSTYLGMFEIYLTLGSPTAPDVGFSLVGPLMFSGTLDQPTMLPGTFPADASSRFFVDGSYQPTVSGVVVQAQTPEPFTGMLCGAAILGLAIIRRRPGFHL
jgi:hypothetical protein